MAPEAVMRLVQAAITVLDLDNYTKKQNPLSGMGTQGRIELAAAIAEGNHYLSSVQAILGQEDNEDGPLV